MSEKEFITKDGILEAYKGKSEHISVPPQVTYIHDFAFANNLSIRSVELPNSVEEMGNAVFAGCQYPRYRHRDRFKRL